MCIFLFSIEAETTDLEEFCDFRLECGVVDS